MVDGRHLENRYDVITLPWMIRFRWNSVCRWKTTCRWQWKGQNRSKSGVEFQYGGRLFLETGSSNISAMDWNIWSKFGTLIALRLPKCQTWPNQKPEVDLRCYGCEFRTSDSTQSLLSDMNSLLSSNVFYHSYCLRLRQSGVQTRSRVM